MTDFGCAGLHDLSDGLAHDAFSAVALLENVIAR
jgi:hypothetical protein